MSYVVFGAVLLDCEENNDFDWSWKLDPLVIKYFPEFKGNTKPFWKTVASMGKAVIPGTSYVLRPFINNIEGTAYMICCSITEESDRMTKVKVPSDHEQEELEEFLTKEGIEYVDFGMFLFGG